MNKETPEPRTMRDGWQIALLALMFLIVGTFFSLASHRSSRRTIALPPSPPRARHYPDFPDGVSQPPQWLRQDAPFDLDRAFVVIPRDLNAAPLYVDAFFEFAPELGYCFPSEEAEMRAPVARLRSR
jgi:hypothetical protein